MSGPSNDAAPPRGTRAHNAARSRTLWRVAATLALPTLGACGEVYADIDVRTVTRAEPVFVPSALFAGSVAWLEVRARFDGTQAIVESHGLDGSEGIKLAYDRLGFFPGACPDGDVTESAAGGGAATALQDATGAWLFCAAVEVGPLDTTTTLEVPFVFWNGAERVTGSAGLTVNVVVAP